MTSIYDIIDWEQLIHQVDKDNEERVRVKIDKLVVAAFYELFSAKIKNWGNLSESERNGWATGIKEELEEDCRKRKLYMHLYSSSESINKKINEYTPPTSSNITESACNYIISYLAYLLILNLYKNDYSIATAGNNFFQTQTVGRALYEAYLNSNRMYKFSHYEEVYRYWRNFILKKLIKYSERRGYKFKLSKQKIIQHTG